MRPPYSVLARWMGPGGAGALGGARDVKIHPSILSIRRRLKLVGFNSSKEGCCNRAVRAAAWGGVIRINL